MSSVISNAAMNGYAEMNGGALRRRRGIKSKSVNVRGRAFSGAAFGSYHFGVSSEKCQKT
jgi:hypothetical protein